MRKFRKPDEEAEINMTPMLDIVFIMLIFFIVTASFVQESGIVVNQPANQEQQDPEDTDKKNIMISVDNNQRIRVNFRLVDIRRVRANIEQLFAENPEASVVIQAFPSAQTGLVVEIYDQALEASIPRAQISVIQKK
jgi:biopolymer transport protein ExbD